MSETTDAVNGEGAETPAVDPVVEALLVEREGYIVRGLADRKAAVDEQLEARGYAVPVERKAPGSQTASRSRKA